MQAYEYKAIGIGMTLKSRREEALNDLGDQGWELISVSEGCAYFKRPKP